MKSIKTLLLIGIFTSSFAFAQSGAVDVEVKMSNIVTTFVQEKNLGQYDLVNYKTKLNLKMSGSGVMSDILNDNDYEYDETAGSDFTGFIHTKLEPSRNKKNVTLITKVDGKKDDIRTKTSLKTETEIIEGSWNGYLNGETIKLKFTKDGAKTIAKEILNGFTNYLGQDFTREFNGQFSHSMYTKVLNSSNVGTCEVNLKKLTCTTPQIKSEIKVKVGSSRSSDASSLY